MSFTAGRGDLHQLVDELSEEQIEEAYAALRFVQHRRQGRRTHADGNGNGSSQMDPEERAAKVRAARGCLAGLPGSVDDFLRRKHEETLRELEADERRQRGEG
jgi:hypothetical protein